MMNILNLLDYRRKNAGKPSLAKTIEGGAMLKRNELVSNIKSRYRNTIMSALFIGLTGVLVGCGNGVSKFDPDTSSNGPLTIGGSLITSEEAFRLTAYKILSEDEYGCKDCHAGLPGQDGNPTFSHSDYKIAHDEVVLNDKVAFSNANSSRLVQKLKTDLHFCWSDCEDNGTEMILAIQQWATLASIKTSDSSVSDKDVVSLGRLLSDTTNGASTSRYDTNVIAKYEFNEGNGDTVNDTSGVVPALNLTKTANVAWLEGGGIEFNDPVEQKAYAYATVEDSIKLYDKIAGPEGTGEFTIEAWIATTQAENEGPDNPKRIVSYSIDSGSRNFSMNKERNTTQYNFRATFNGTSSNLIEPAPGSVVLDETQHVVMTFSSTEGRKIYVNSKEVLNENPGDRNLDGWSTNHIFLLGNENILAANSLRQWTGKMYFVAIHNTALTLAQVQQNFEAGVGPTSVIEFDVSEHLGPGSAIQMKVSEFDSYSYGFIEPTYVGGSESAIPVKNMRIAINNRIPLSGQTFRKVDVNVSAANPQISSNGAVLPKDLGVDSDEFKLVFEVLGSKSNVASATAPRLKPLITVNDEPASDNGIRSFEQINNSMASLTGVDSNDLQGLYFDVKQALPSSTKINTYSAGNQTNVVKLALEYCSAMVNDATLRDAFFGANNIGNRTAVINALVTKMMGNVTSQPPIESVKTELTSLMSTLDTNNLNDRVVISGCAVMLSSSTLLVQ